MRALWIAALLRVPAWAAPPPVAFSWDTVPVFQHLASVNATFAEEFPPQRLAWLASRFPVVVLEHAHAMGSWAYEGPDGPGSTWGPEPFSPPGGYIEDHFAAAAAQLKALNASITVLYYQQITGALPYYRASGAISAHPAWRLDPTSCAPVADGTEHAGAAGGDGDILPNYVSYAWDHTQAGVTEIFVRSFENVTASTLLDGTYIDTASCYASNSSQQAASDATVRAMQAAVPGRIVGFHTNAEPFSGATAYMDYTFATPTTAAGPNGSSHERRWHSSLVSKKDTSGTAAVAWLDANAAAGAVSFAHIGDIAGGADQVYALAAFLAGAYNQSFFAFSSAEKSAPAWQQCSPGGPTWPAFPTWCTGQGYTPDYDRPLGPPLGPREKTGGPHGEVSRLFASGTRVTVQLAGAACKIAWADGATTECAPSS